jgi:phosphodiesterase/alkaline phosphatase D-like protein
MQDLNNQNSVFNTYKFPWLTDSKLEQELVDTSLFPIYISDKDVETVKKVAEFFSQQDRFLELPDKALPNGVASGDTTQTSTVLWTRSSVPGVVIFEYATNPDFQNAKAAIAYTTNPAQPVKVQVQDLSPGTDYYYRVIDTSGSNSSGKFHTSAPLSTYAGLTFGVSGDWRGDLNPYPAISNADESNLEFFVELGDTILADSPSPKVPVEQAKTLQEFRDKHKEVYSDRFGINTWSDLRSSTSILATIDDHEVTNDFAGGAPAASDPRFETTNGLINETELYRNGLQAFIEYNPIRNDFYGATGDLQTQSKPKLYRYNTYGSDAATFVLDTRSFRDEQLPGVTNPFDSNQITEFLARSFDIDPATGQPSEKRRTLLGQAQLNQFKQDLLKAEHDGITWKFITIPEPIQNLELVGARDRYEGYAAERTELLKFIDDHNIQNVVFIAADLHGTIVNNLTYQLGPGQPQIPTSAFEVITGPVADTPFAPFSIETGAQLGFLPPEQKAFYDSLPVIYDADSIPNDKDDFFKQSLDAQLTPLGYDPIGLNNNLASANDLIDAKLVQGDYLSTTTYGWTKFGIDSQTQKLTVTTYGIPYYTQAELEANPSAISSYTPTIVSQFEVNPNLSFIG